MNPHMQKWAKPHGPLRIFKIGAAIQVTQHSFQLIKIFSVVLKVSLDDIAEDLEQGNVGETIKKFFVKSDHPKQSKNSLTIIRVDEFLEELTKKTKEDQQVHHFKTIIKECTPNGV